MRNDAGQVGDWLGQSNGGFVNNASFGATVSSDWHVLATGDFNGDGRTDVLWRNDNGTVTDWLGQSNGSLASNPVYASIPTNWHVVATGDFNGDGIDDILVRSDTGQIGDWLGQSNGGFVNNASFGGTVPTSWHVQDPFVHDGIF